MPSFCQSSPRITNLNCFVLINIYVMQRKTEQLRYKAVTQNFAEAAGIALPLAGLGKGDLPRGALANSEGHEEP